MPLSILVALQYQRNSKDANYNLQRTASAWTTDVASAVYTMALAALVDPLCRGSVTNGFVSYSASWGEPDKEAHGIPQLPAAAAAADHGLSTPHSVPGVKRKGTTTCLHPDTYRLNMDRRRDGRRR